MAVLYILTCPEAHALYVFLYPHFGLIWMKTANCTVRYVASTFVFGKQILYRIETAVALIEAAPSIWASQNQYCQSRVAS